MMLQFKFAVVSILVLLVKSDEDNICFAKGECENSVSITSSITLGENSCLNFCGKVEGCNWFTYNSKNNVCVAFSSCPEVVPEGCPECLSGQIECPYIDNKCWVKGFCKGTMLHEVNAGSSEECNDLCLSFEGCGWFSYNSYPSVCFLFQDCPTLDESCESCVSSSALCKAKTSYTKLLVGVGFTESGKRTEVEIIDLESSLSNCSNLKDFPKSTYDAIGGLEFNDNPVICGGAYKQECFSWQDSTWQVYEPLTVKRSYASSCTSPFPKESHKLLVAGGYDGSAYLSTVEILTKNGWEEVKPSLPVTSDYSCMVLLNSTTAFLIGGRQQGSTYSPNSYLLNTAANSQEWIQGPRLNYGRNYHSCARIRTDSSSRFSIIVVGGSNGTDMTSVEILDDGADVWRNGPDLPFGIYYASLVEDPTGGVILVGGYSNNDDYLQTLFRLSHAGDDAEWVEMPQKLKIGRRYHTSFLVTDDIATCSIQTK